MKATVRTAATTAGITILLAITGCTSNDSADEGTGKVPEHMPTTTSTLLPEGTVLPQDTVLPESSTDAANLAGITEAEYTEIQSQVGSLWASTGDEPSFTTALEDLDSDKPVAVIFNSKCAGGDTNGWDIAGALAGEDSECGTGTSQSRLATTAVAAGKAASKGWTPDDYILIYTDFTK